MHAPCHKSWGSLGDRPHRLSISLTLCNMQPTLPYTHAGTLIDSLPMNGSQNKIADQAAFDKG